MCTELQHSKAARVVILPLSGCRKTPGEQQICQAAAGAVVRDGMSLTECLLIAPARSKPVGGVRPERRR